MLKEIPVALSGHIASISYDSDTMELFVTFKRSGSIYRYDQVTEDVVTGIGQALSVGKYFNLYIRDSFSFEQVG